MEVIVTSVKDSGLLDKYFRRHEILVAVICFVIFLVGIPYVFEVGPVFLTFCPPPSCYIKHFEHSRTGRHLYFPTGGLLWVGHLSDVHRFLRVHRRRVAVWG